MKILHCAPFNIFTKVGGSLYANPIKLSHGFIQNGHFVHNFDYRDSARYLSIFKNKKHGQTKMNQFFLTLIQDIKPDLIIFGHAELIYHDTFEAIKKQNIPMIYWYNDLPLHKNFAHIAHYFDVILATAGGMFIEQLKKMNQNSFFMPNLVDHNVEQYVAYSNPSHTYDILFSGRLDQERQQVITYLRKNFHNNLKIIGDSKETTIIGEKYFHLIQDSKICINHNRDFTVENEWYTSDRLMHILGNGSFCLSRTILHGEDFFEDKLDYYETLEELHAKLDYYLQNPEERIKKAKWLHERVHTLFNAKRVCKYILNLLEHNPIQLQLYEWYK